MSLSCPGPPPRHSTGGARLDRRRGRPASPRDTTENNTAWGRSQSRHGRPGTEGPGPEATAPRGEGHLAFTPGPLLRRNGSNRRPRGRPQRAGGGWPQEALAPPKSAGLVVRGPAAARGTRSEGRGPPLGLGLARRTGRSGNGSERPRGGSGPAPIGAIALGDDCQARPASPCLTVRACEGRR